MENTPSVSAKTSSAAKRVMEAEQPPSAEVILTPESHEELVQEFVEDSGEVAVEATVELDGATEDATELEQGLEAMDYSAVDKNIDSLIESGVNPDLIFDKLGPNLYYNRNISKLLDAGLSPIKALDTLSKGGVNVVSSSVVAQNLDAFIKSGVGTAVIAEHLEPGWLSASFDKLYAAGLDLRTVDQLISEGKVKPEDIEKRREERAGLKQLDEAYGVDNVLDFSTGKTILATRPDHQAAA